MLRVVSLDLDGTLVKPAIFNAVADEVGFGAPLLDTYRRYLAGALSIPQAFELDYAHFVGRRVADLHAALDRSRAWTPGIKDAIARFHDAGARVVLTTDQPRFLAEYAHRFGVDDLVCSAARVDADGCVTADVTPAFDKWPNLARYLDENGFAARDVAHVGNGSNDIPVFERVGVSVAVNYESENVATAATHAIKELRDLGEVADVLLGARGAEGAA